MTLGLTVVLALAVAAFLALSLRSEAVLRLALQHVWLTVAVNVVGTALLVALLLLLDAPMVAPPAAAVTVTGLVLLLVSTGLEWRTHAAGGLDDPITGPGEAAPRTGGQTGGWLTVLLFPVLTALLLGLSWVLELLA